MLLLADYQLIEGLYRNECVNVQTLVLNQDLRIFKMNCLLLKELNVNIQYNKNSLSCIFET